MRYRVTATGTTPATITDLFAIGGVNMMTVVVGGVNIPVYKIAPLFEKLNAYYVGGATSYVEWECDIIITGITSAAAGFTFTTLVLSGYSIFTNYQNTGATGYISPGSVYLVSPADYGDLTDPGNMIIKNSSMQLIADGAGAITTLALGSTYYAIWPNYHTPTISGGNISVSRMDVSDSVMRSKRLVLIANDSTYQNNYLSL